MPYTEDHIKAAFNAGKYFATYEDWVKWSAEEIRKISTSDPLVLSGRISSIGGKVRERESKYHIEIDLRSIDRQTFDNFLHSELFEHRGYGSSDLYQKYISPKYNRMSIDYDSSYGFVRIFHLDPITKDQEKRDIKINKIVDGQDT